MGLETFENTFKEFVKEAWILLKVETFTKSIVYILNVMHQEI